MKKVITLLVVMLLVAGLATAAFAAEVGETVTVEFVTVENPGFGSYNAEISYDKTALELVEVKEGALSAGKGFFVYAESAGYMGLTDVTGDGVLFTATFKVLETAKDGKYDVTAALVPNSSSNVAGEAVTFAIKGATVEVSNPCEHVWDDGVVTTPATCEEAGVMTYTCTLCGETKTAAIDALGHDWDDGVVTTEATCGTDGVMTYTCANCGETKTEVIKATGDHKGPWTYEDKDDYHHWKICVCGHKSEEAHEYDDNICVFCGHEKDEKLDPVPGTGDITPVVVTTALSMVAMIALAAYMLKRKFAV